MRTSRCSRIVTLALALATGVACGHDRTSYPAALAEAERLVRARAYEDAYRLFDRLRQRYPDERDPYQRLAWLAERLDQPARPIAAMQERVDRGGPDVWFYLDVLATLQEKADLWDEAEANYREVLRLNADHPPTYRKLSRLMARSGRYPQAQEIARQGVERFPDAPRLRTWYGDVLMQVHRWDDAERELLRAVELPDADALPHYNLGLVYLNTGRPDEARRQLDEATRLAPLVADHWYQLANACQQVGDDEGRDRALERFESVFRQQLGDGQPDAAEEAEP